MAQNPAGVFDSAPVHFHIPKTLICTKGIQMNDRYWNRLAGLAAFATAHVLLAGNLAQAGVLLWLDASEFSAANPALTTWADKSGASNDAMAVGVGNEPSVVLNQMNGLPVVRFDDSGPVQAMQTPAVAVPSKTMHAFIVAQTSDNLGHALVYERNGSTDLVYFSFLQNQTISHGARFDGSGSNLVTSAGSVWNTSSPGLISSLINADASGELRVNGGAANLSSGGTTFGTLNKSFFVGASDGLSNPLDGDLAEIVVFDAALSDDERIGVQHLLGEKWGLAGIPAATDAQIAAADALFPGGGFLFVIPEPSTSWMLGLGVLGRLRRSRRRMARGVV